MTNPLLRIMRINVNASCVTHSIAIFVAICLGACAGAEQRALQSPEDVQIVKGEASRLADCAYSKLNERLTSYLRKADMPSRGAYKIIAEGSGVLYWELTLQELTKTETEARLFVGKNIWGGAIGAESRSVMPTLRACL